MGKFGKNNCYKRYANPENRGMFGVEVTRADGTAHVVDIREYGYDVYGSTPKTKKTNVVKKFKLDQMN